MIGSSVRRLVRLASETKREETWAAEEGDLESRRKATPRRPARAETSAGQSELAEESTSGGGKGEPTAERRAEEVF